MKFIIRAHKADCAVRFCNFEQRFFQEEKKQLASERTSPFLIDGP